MCRENLLEKAIASIEEIVVEKVRKNYKRALEQSIELYPEKPSKNPSVTEISKACGISPGYLFQYLIALDKKNARLFLENCGIKMSLAQIRNKLSQKAYSKKFKRDVTRDGNRQLFTYAEILVFFDHTVNLELPM